ncbi:MAG: hypothetical protein ACR2MM_02480 [Flavobacteriaceae bacterium]
MNPKLLFWTICVALVFWNCSNDDGEEMQPASLLEIPDFQLIAEDAESIYWYSYNAELESANTINLTQEDNLNRFYISLRQVADKLSFFSLFDGNFSLFQKNTSNNGTVSVQDFISITAERSIIWGTTTESQIIMAYYSPPSSGELGVRTLDIESGSFVDTPLASNVFDTSEPLYHNQRLFAAYLDNNNRYKMVVFDTENLLIIRAFDFQDQFPSLLINEEGNLEILLGREGIFGRQVFDIVTMDLIDSENFSLGQFLETGPLEAFLVNNKLYYQYSLVQPSPLPSTPAVFDFTTGDSHIVDIVSIRDIFLEETGQVFVPTAFGFSVEERVFLMAYAVSTSDDSFDGGVLVISENGDLIDILELPFIPTYFIKS